MSTYSDTNAVDLYDRDDSSGKQQWEFTQIELDDTYNIRLPTGPENLTYLSVTPGGATGMWRRDDDSGR